MFGLLAAGMSREQILAEYPLLEDGDVDAALAYGADVVFSMPSQMVRRSQSAPRG